MAPLIWRRQRWYIGFEKDRSEFDGRSSHEPPIEFKLRRRTFLAGTATIAAAANLPWQASAQQASPPAASVGPERSTVALVVNGEERTIELDNRSALRQEPCQ